MEESNAQDQQIARQAFIRTYLAAEGETGLSTQEIRNLVLAAWPAASGETVDKDLSAMSDVGLMRVDGKSRWYLIQKDKPAPVVHSLPAGAESTLCCGRYPEDLPAGEVFADGPGQVTCGVDAPVETPQSRRELFRQAVVDRIGELNVLVDAGTATDDDLAELAFAEKWLQDLGFTEPAPAKGRYGLDAIADARTTADMPEVPDVQQGAPLPRTGVYRQTDDGGSVLEMPWTVVKSEGGVYDDDSFAAGVVAGVIQEMLSVGKKLGMTMSVPVLIPKEMREQVDAIAMRFDYYVLTTPAWDDPEYDSGYVLFTSEIPHQHDPDDDDRDLFDDGDSD